jgi:YD repeat-containing protein
LPGTAFGGTMLGLKPRNGGTAMGRVSDRERAHLRGPVKTVVDDRHRTEYDRQGNVVCWQVNHPDGSQYGDSYAYENGRLNSIVSRQCDGSTAEKSYSYDSAGRLMKIIDTHGETITFDYGKEGHKTETRVLKNTNQPGAVGIDSVFADVDGTALLDYSFGGNAHTFKTIYNDRDQPTETQAYGVAGDLLGRVLRTFDQHGRVTDVREITDNPLSMFPAKELSGMIASSGISPDEIRAEMSKHIKAFGSEKTKSYRYDAQGHIVKADIDGTLGTFTRTYVYNEHGDVVEENTVLARDTRVPVGVPFNLSDTGEIIPQKPPSGWPPEPDLGASSNIRYRYKYDHQGNWTEKTASFNQQPSGAIHREMTYWKPSES